VSRTRLHAYPGPAQLEERWRALVAIAGGTESVAGRSVEGRPLWRFDLAGRDPNAPAVLMTALIHGNEVVGSLALHEVIVRLQVSGELARESRRIVVMPIANPDGFAATMDRLGHGLVFGRRRNAAGVDLNRNFPPARPDRASSASPLAGSAWRRSPWFRGPHPLSEPEARAIAEVAGAVRPSLALGFHSFGELLLHPWACDAAVHPRQAQYQALGEAFRRGAPAARFEVRQAARWYRIIGNLDDWLDASFGTLAFTVEVSRPDRQLLHPRGTNPFWWANPFDPRRALEDVAPCVLALLAASRPARGAITAA